MSFVFPALLGTLVLAGIPVLLHLILRQKPKTLPFPAFRFLVARHRSNQRKLQLRHLFLLLLRIALLAGLIVAVARPRILQRNLGLSSERPVAAIFVLDVSPSMEYRSTDNQTRLDDARKRALELLQNLPAGSRIEILTSADASGVRGEWILNPAQARQRITDLKIRPSSPPLGRAVATALRHFAELAQNRADEAGMRLPRLLGVFSDTTRGAWDPESTPTVLEALDAIPLTREAVQDARAEIIAVLANAKERRATPSGLAADTLLVSLEETLVELRDLIPRLSASDFPLQDRPAQLVQQARQTSREVLRGLAAAEAGKDKEKAEPWADSLRSLLRNLAGVQTMWIDVGMSEPRDLGMVRLEWPQRGSAVLESFAPGEKFLVQAETNAVGQEFQTTFSSTLPRNLKRPVAAKPGQPVVVPLDLDPEELKLKPGYHSFELDVEANDAWTGNNRRYATFLLREPPKVLILADASELVQLFAEALTKGLLYAVEVKPPSFAEGGVPAGYQAVYLFAASTPSEPLWRALEDFVKRGGGLGIVPGGKEMQIAAYHTPTARGIVPGEWKVIGKPQVPAKEDGAGWRWDPPSVFRHPILRPFEKWRRDPNIDFNRSPALAFSFWEVTPAANADVLVNYQEDKLRPAILERKLGSGKVVQLTTRLDPTEPRWTNYLQSSFFVVLTGLCTAHLTGESEPVRCNFVVPREEPFVSVRSLAGKTDLSLRGPQGIDPVKVPPDAVRLPLPLATLPGNYTLVDAASKDREVLAAFSVNLSPEEATLTRLPRHDVEDLFGADALVAVDRQADLRQLLKGHWSEPVELFPYFMVALLLLLALENLLANRFYRQEDVPADLKS